MANTKLSDAKVRLVQNLISDGVTVKEIVETTGVRRSSITDIRHERLVFCHACEISHDGPQCRPKGELREELLASYETCQVCQKDHPGEPCPEIKRFALIDKDHEQTMSYNSTQVIDMRK